MCSRETQKAVCTHSEQNSHFLVVQGGICQSKAIHQQQRQRLTSLGHGCCPWERCSPVTQEEIWRMGVLMDGGEGVPKGTEI